LNLLLKKDLTFSFFSFIIKFKKLDYIKKEEGKMNRQKNRIAVAAEIEYLIEEIYERLDCIRELLWEVDDSLANRAESYWLAHIDGALLNRSGVGGSFITAADTLEELEEGEKV
jgi:hypothetical protein